MEVRYNLYATCAELLFVAHVCRLSVTNALEYVILTSVGDGGASERLGQFYVPSFMTWVDTVVSVIFV